MVKKVLFSILILVLIPVLYISYRAARHNFFPQYAEYSSNPKVTIGLELKAMHPMLAEYKKKLIVTWANESVKEIEMFPDTGGYTQSNLYFSEERGYLLKSFFDCFSVYPDSQIISSPASSTIIHRGQACSSEGYIYVGTFSFENGWNFLTSEQSPEQNLLAN